MTVRQESFTTFEAADKLGIRIERLRDWINRRYIVPDLEQASGRGTKGRFSRSGLCQIKVFDHLIQRGFSRIIATGMARLVTLDEKEKGTPPDFIWHAKRTEGDEGGGTWRVDEPFPIKDFGQYLDVHFVNVGKIRRAVDDLL
jgi:hypothetical protein